MRNGRPEWHELTEQQRQQRTLSSVASAGRSRGLDGSTAILNYYERKRAREQRSLMRDQLQNLADQVTRLLHSEAEALSVKRGAPIWSSVASLFRPYIAAVYDTTDARKREWSVSVLVLELHHDKSIREAHIVTEGRTVGLVPNGTSFGACDTVTGADGVVKLIADALRAAGLPADLFGDLDKAFLQLRPTISRQRGNATMRRKTADERFSLTVDVWRAGLEPAYEPTTHKFTRLPSALEREAGLPVPDGAA